MSSLLRGFTDSVQHYPTRAALYLDGHYWSYEQLAERAARIALAISNTGTSSPLVGILAAQGLTAYSSILGVLAAGKGYVPIYPYFPAERIIDIIIRSEIDVLIIAENALDHLQTLLEGCPRELTIIAPDVSDLSVWRDSSRSRRLLSSSDLPADASSLGPPDVEPHCPAYLLFTSGSTGTPKGVAVSHSSARAYIDHISRAYQVRPDDRISQTFKLAFDLSVHDLFVTWSSGACLYPLSRRARMAPGRFIRSYELTLWFSVPTLGMTMDRFRQLAPGAFPSLRASLFCGEALPASLAQKWSAAAPNSTVDNLYGPTEATIAVTSYRWKGEESLRHCRNGVVPLGRAFPGQETLILDPETNERGEQTGELLLSGSQLTDGYWRAPQLTEESFIGLESAPGRRWYRTGDLVVEDDQGCLHFLGRIDDQIQLGGHRIELAEIDFALRQACNHDLAIAVAWPYRTDEVGGIVGFIAADSPVDEAALLSSCRRRLPAYMIPERIVTLATLPCNSNGKIDRSALRAMLDNDEV